MRNWKHVTVLGILLLAAAMGRGVPVLAENSGETAEEKETGESAETETTTEKNGERKTTITLVSVTGNKITYIEQETEEVTEEATEEVTEGTTEGTTVNSNDASGGAFPGGGSMPEDFPGGRDMPEGFSGGRDMPEGFSGKDKSNAKTVYLPVSVPVHVGDTEVRTFTILQAGDTLEVTLVTDDDGEEVITEIWLKKVSEGS